MLIIIDQQASLFIQICELESQSWHWQLELMAEFNLLVNFMLYATVFKIKSILSGVSVSSCQF